MKKNIALIICTLMSSALATSVNYLQKIDNQSSCTLRLIDNIHSWDAKKHVAPSIIDPRSIGFIEMEGTRSSQFINSYAVICDQQQVGVGQIFNNNKGGSFGTTLFFQGEGISWDHYRSFWTRVYPSYVVVKNK